jgi:hypothetical protein
MKYVDELIYWEPQRKLGGGWICFKSEPSAPEPPDPAKTAAAQTQSNAETARMNAQLNRVNQTTPWGSLTYSQNTTPDTFDQAGFDAAMKGYQDAQNRPSQPTGQMVESGELPHYWETAPSPSAGMAAPNRADFTKPGNSDTWNSTITLSPEQQKLLDSSNRISQSLANVGEGQLGTVGQMLGKPLRFDGAPGQVSNVSYGNIQNDIDMSKVPGLIGGDRLADGLSTQRDSLYNQQKAFLDPQWQQDQHDLENKLVQQGVMQNSDAWNRAIGNQQRNKEFSYNNARMSAITGGGAEQSRLFGLGLAANQNAYGQALNNGQFHNGAQTQGFGQAVTNANLQNQARTQSINEIMALRQNPLNELNALRTGSQVTSPQFSSVPQTNVAPTDVAGPINSALNAQLAGYNAQVAQNNGVTGGLFSLGAAAITAY